MVAALGAPHLARSVDGIISVILESLMRSLGWKVRLLSLTYSADSLMP